MSSLAVLPLLSRSASRARRRGRQLLLGVIWFFTSSRSIAHDDDEPRQRPRPSLAWSDRVEFAFPACCRPLPSSPSSSPRTLNAPLSTRDRLTSDKRLVSPAAPPAPHSLAAAARTAFFPAVLSLLDAVTATACGSVDFARFNSVVSGMAAVLHPQGDVLAVPPFPAEHPTSSRLVSPAQPSPAPPMEKSASSMSATSVATIAGTKGKAREVVWEQDSERARMQAEIERSLRQLEGRSGSSEGDERLANDAALAEDLLRSQGETSAPPSQDSPDQLVGFNHHGVRTSSDSHRLSVATLDSMLTTGETVYEDAWEEFEAEDEDAFDEPALPPLPLNLARSPILPDTPPSEKELAAASLTPKVGSLDATPQTSPLNAATGFSPRSAFEEQATLLQQRAALQLEAARISTARHSLSIHPSEAAVKLLTRRYSAVPRISTQSFDTPQAAKITSPTSPNRPWHPKPLVLTPARTVHTPLTTSSAISPGRRRGSLTGSERGGRSRSGSLTTTTPPRLMSPTRAHLAPSARSSATVRRRSMGYIDSSSSLNSRPTSIVSPVLPPKRDSVASSVSSPRLPLSRNRSASEDTTSSQTTRTTASSRARLSGSTDESPVSSVWSDEKDGLRIDSHGSPIGNSGVEFDRTWSRRGSAPLPAVSETDGPETAKPTSPEREKPLPSSPRMVPLPRPVTAQEASTIGLSTVSEAPVVSIIASSPSTIRSPASPRPSGFSPRETYQTSTKRTKYDEHWTGGFASDSAAEESDFGRPSLDVAAAHAASGYLTGVSSRSDSPASPVLGSSDGEKRHSMATRRKPIVIRSGAARSSAAFARRSQRLSQLDPAAADGSHRLSRVVRRLSGVGKDDSPSLPSKSQLAGPLPATTRRQSTHSSKVRFDERRLSTARSPPSSAAAVWPPPEETKTISLAPTLSYNSESESSAGLSGRDSETDDDMARYRKPFGTFSSRPRRTFEPRDPRSRIEEADFGPESFLEVLLNEEPPARPRAGSYDSRWSGYSTGALESETKGSMPASKTFGTVKPAKGLTNKLFGALAKSPKLSSSDDRPRRPVSIAPRGSPAADKRRPSTRPRPVVSGPLELEAASSAMRQQGSHGSTGSSTSFSSQEYSSVRSGFGAYSRASLRQPIPTIKRGGMYDETAEELASFDFTKQAKPSRTSPPSLTSPSTRQTRIGSAGSVSPSPTQLPLLPSPRRSSEGSLAAFPTALKVVPLSPALK
ncbi:Proteophosphoglycan ppg4 [Rhodotorula toruloides ATCC 204091]|nr:Proteophosphoglycan ppg4 [Rhodotorula toruloides ATCC 204091]